MSVRYGIIGLGNQGTSYLFNIFEGGKAVDAVVSAVCDNNPAKIEAVKARAPKCEPAYFENYIEMLDSGLCDAVLVEVPHYQHPEMVMECLKRGIHVICEKPAGVYTKQVKEMNEAAKGAKALFGMMFNQRTNCLYRKMREIIADGGIGELQRVNWIITDWYRTQQYYDSGSWRATWSGEGGGVLINQCPHQIDLVQWVVGEMPVEVNGFCQYGKWHDIEVEDEVTAYFRYKNGATGVFVTTTGETPGTNRFEVSGSRGKLLCEDGKLWWYKNEEDGFEWSRTCPEGFTKPKCEKIEVETDGLNLQHVGIINNFTAAILGKEELFVGGTDGIAGVELMNAIELSGWNGGETVALPVDEDRYLRELDAHRAVSRLKIVDDSKVTDTAGTYGGNKVKFRCAVVGHGGIGKLHARIAAKYGELCAVCDVDPSKLQSFDEAIRYTDYKTMLDAVRPDVVHICTPHYLHADMVVEALGRGINVLCEKPLCIKREDIDRILEAERQSGAMLGVCLQNRYNASNLFVKEYLEGKKIDNASGIVFWHRDAAYYASGEWRGKWETEGGGVLINQALHTLDLLIWICGEPSEITASTSTLTLAEHIEVEDTATLVCHGENPFIFSATNCSARDCPVELTLFADGECIKVLSRDVLVGGELHHFEDAYKPLGKVCYGSGHEALITDFYDCIASGRRFAIDGSEGAKVVKVILGAYESQGKKIEIK